MAVPGAEDVYLTLLLTDTYLPGALVLAHSLRDGGTKKKLGVLVTLDSVGAEAITQLKTVYDYVIPVPRIKNHYPANLSLMNRADLASAFTKINLWKQTNFRKIVYVDADIIAYRAPDELFDLPYDFSAAPDIGWPDIFNTGVMVLTPKMGEYYALSALAERGISFDGADQGLLNMHFKNTFNRLSFTYNVTPSGHYQYVPAYRHFQSSINMVHFIGAEKPWFQGRHASTGGGPYDEMIGRWWAVYDRHYRVESPGIKATSSTADLVQYLTKGEFRPPQPEFAYHEQATRTGEPWGEHRHEQAQPESSSSTQSQYYSGQSGGYPERHRVALHNPDGPSGSAVQYPTASAPSSFVEGKAAEARVEHAPERHRQADPPHPPQSPPEQKQQERPPIAFSEWDAQRHPPPADSKPEAAHFPVTTYEMSTEIAPFVPPERYPSPPKDLWYEIPEQPPAYRKQKPKTIFPWEANQPRPTRVFKEDPPQSPEPETGPSNAPMGHTTAEQDQVPVTPTTPIISITPSDPWTNFTRTNAWDDVPEIERYVDKLQKHRRTRSLKSPGTIEVSSPGGEVGMRDLERRGSKVTDFPSETERPSLPVTPAPIRRARFWGGGAPGIGDDEHSALPAAEGVPEPGEWDPAAQLQKLAKQQSEALLEKLGGTSRDVSSLPSRAVPFGSEQLTSPTYVAQSPQVLSPQPVKGSASSSIVRSIVAEEAMPQTSTRPETVPVPGTIAAPSYGGPGAEFEKGENYLNQSTPALPSEEERDVVDT